MFILAWQSDICFGCYTWGKVLYRSNIFQTAVSTGLLTVANEFRWAKPAHESEQDPYSTAATVCFDPLAAHGSDCWPGVKNFHRFLVAVAGISPPISPPADNNFGRDLPNSAREGGFGPRKILAENMSQRLFVCFSFRVP